MRYPLVIASLLLLASILSGYDGKKQVPGMALEITTDKKIYTVGEPVKMHMKVSNKGKKAITSYYGSSQKFDLKVADSKGRIIWEWSHNKMFAMVITPFQLEPGKSISYSYIWKQKNDSGKQVSPGKYNMSGELAIAPRIKAKRRAITIR